MTPTRLKMLEIALSEYGVKEIPGKLHNPEVLRYFTEIGHKWVTTDETAWCAAFINWVCLKAGIEGTGKLNARSFLDWGRETHNPEPGDLVILWRESPKSWKGHVGEYINQNQHFIKVLGGNQSNQVKISNYPRGRLLQFRTAQ